ncbi:DUF2913 family protein [Thaumasiovibrio subtropicus]|uniref:DUF2913 family protein n=1 Tax=Thaumasiovibrio subtropicus TaxID=1891207 RepID=UPI000B35441C|nr:DUF2913 family protein [Thaumasiovibrio subtropicus]
MKSEPRVFNQHLLTMVELGLGELQDSIESGKTSATPVSETYFLSSWVTKAIKQQRFHPCLKAVLLQWQQQSRSMGKNAALKKQFADIQTAYRQQLKGREAFEPLKEAQLRALFDELVQLDWEVTLEYPVLRKVSHFTEGQASLVVCCEQQTAAFKDGEVIKPLSLYVRGDKHQLIDLAAKHDVLLHKVTDYKSKVKYHGEYLVYPTNDGPIIAELPSIAD